MAGKVLSQLATVDDGRQKGNGIQGGMCSYLGGRDLSMSYKNDFTTHLSSRGDIFKF